MAFRAVMCGLLECIQVDELRLSLKCAKRLWSFVIWVRSCKALVNDLNIYLIGSQIRQDYPLNLSISISGGKETNKDSPSNGE